MIKCANKRGDTLIEVMLAVGIFSMVAVAVVAVMNGGTSEAQTSLEATLAREEIDAQAEALRFIHRAYVIDKNSGQENNLGKLWKEIIKKAITSNPVNPEIINYSPTSCSKLYDDAVSSQGEAYQYGFLINTRQLGATNPTAATTIIGKDKLKQTVTYPRLFNDTGELMGQSDTATGEGIYIIAIKDPTSTQIGKNKTSAYYDFYIRTCWYGTNDQTPSTISTLIRLYDPDAI